MDYRKNLKYSHLQYILDWFTEYEVNGSLSIKQIKKQVSSKRKVKKFINNLEKLISKVEEDEEEIGVYIKIRNKNVFKNSCHNEKKKCIV